MKARLIIALIWLASLVAVGFWQRHDGKTVERDAWMQRENTELRTANATINRLQEEKRQQEQNHAMAVAAIAERYEKELSDANAQLETDRAAVRAGGLRLYDHAAGLRACGSIVGETRAGPGERDGAEGSELSAETTEFLVSEANRADAIVKQLTECQAVVKADREMCGAKAE